MECSITLGFHGLSPDIHGLNIHMCPNCSNGSETTEGHLDPEKTGQQHLRPYKLNGHLGDLPA